MNSPMNEHRYNPATGLTSIYVPERGQRPLDEAPPKKPVESPESCPFCPGNEAMLPEILEQTPGPGPAGWTTRVAPNKFPGVRLDAGGETGAHGPYGRAPAHGRHEIIIESPGHDLDLAQMGPAELCAVVDTYHRRYSTIERENPGLTPVLFRNHGPSSGASLGHPHAQLMAVRGRPPGLGARAAAARRHFEENGRCALCDIAAFERRERRRMIAENESFLVFVPFAAAGPSEVWLVPKRHEPSFGAIGGPERKDLAAALGDALHRIHRGLDDPDYNFFICSLAETGGEAYLHWWLEIRPRLTILGGYELASCVTVVPSVPEDDAARLRKAGA